MEEDICERIVEKSTHRLISPNLKPMLFQEFLVRSANGLIIYQVFKLFATNIILVDFLSA